MQESHVYATKETIDLPMGCFIEIAVIPESSHMLSKMQNKGEDEEAYLPKTSEQR